MNKRNIILNNYLELVVKLEATHALKTVIVSKRNVIEKDNGVGM